jgi:hypothetical protein
MRFINKQPEWINLNKKDLKLIFGRKNAEGLAKKHEVKTIYTHGSYGPSGTGKGVVFNPSGLYAISIKKKVKKANKKSKNPLHKKTAPATQEAKRLRNKWW